MPLTLITGPANAGKAQLVLDAVRAARDAAPLLIVPTAPDVDRYQRELAAAGVVLGVEVGSFALLLDHVAERAGYGQRTIGRVARERLVAVAVRRAGLRALAPSAASPGFARAAGELLAELGRAGVDPPRLGRALRAWAGDDPARMARGEEIAAIHREYRGGLDHLDRVDRELFAWRALDALAAAPGSWGARPVFLYGFDDLTQAQVHAVETLASTTEVTLALAFEPGRHAFAGRAGTVNALAPLAARHVQLQARADYYAPAARTALDHLQRRLFEEDPVRVAPGGAVRLLAAGGERAEVELVAAEVLALLRDGRPAEEIAVAFRAPERSAALVEQVFGAYGIPYALERRIAFGHTALGRGLLALVRCALLDGSADDLLTWLRTPGKLDRPELADALEVAVRRAGIRRAAEARRVWEEDQGRFPLEELDRLQGAAQAGPLALLEELQRRLAALFARPLRGRAPVLEADELVDARALAVGAAAIAELEALVRADPRLAPDPPALAALLATLEVRAGERPGPGRVWVAHPLSLRARRCRALFLCGLQEGEFPRRPRPDPFLADGDRRELAQAAGLRLGPAGGEHGTAALATLADERHLFYAAVSRPEELLVLAFRTGDEEGRGATRSPFVRDVCELFDGLEPAATTRSLADVTWDVTAAPTAAELERALAALGPRSEEPPLASLATAAGRASLRAARGFSVGALERYAECPIGWFVDKELDPAPLAPDPEPLVAGRVAHDALAGTLAALRAETGSARVTPRTLPIAERLLGDALADAVAEQPIAPDATRAAAALRRLAAELTRHLRHEAAAGEPWEPTALECGFGLGPETLPPLELDDGAVSVRGRIDRVDVDPSGRDAVVRDYKSRSTAEFAGARWEADRVLQVPLYMLAVERLLGLRVVGGLHHPLSGPPGQRRPRGLLLAGPDVDELIGRAYVKTDVVGEEDFRAGLARAEALAVELAHLARDGALEQRPRTCTKRGGCRYPGICRGAAR